MWPRPARVGVSDVGVHENSAALAGGLAVSMTASIPLAVALDVRAAAAILKISPSAVIRTAVTDWIEIHRPELTAGGWNGDGR